MDGMATGMGGSGRCGASRTPVIVGIWGILSAALQACLICLPVPTTSAVENLLEAEYVVVAREDPDDPSSLRTVEVLKGEPAGRPDRFFVESPATPTVPLTSRRMVVCAYRADGPRPGVVEDRHRGPRLRPARPGDPGARGEMARRPG